MTYLAFQPGIAPPWLQGPVGGAFLGVEGQAKDLVLQAMKDAIFAGFTLRAPSDALPALGAESSIPRLPGELDPSYRGRIVARWSTWPLAGTSAGILAALSLIGYTASRILTTRSWAAPATVPGGTGWSRFWVLLAPVPTVWRGRTLGDGHRLGGPLRLGDGRRLGDGHRLGDRPSLGSTATRAETAAVVRTVQTWKSARDIGFVTVVLKGRLLGTGGHLGDGHSLGAHHVTWTAE